MAHMPGKPLAADVSYSVPVAVSTAAPGPLTLRTSATVFVAPLMATMPLAGEPPKVAKPRAKTTSADGSTTTWPDPLSVTGTVAVIVPVAPSITVRGLPLDTDVTYTWLVTGLTARSSGPFTATLWMIESVA